MHTVISNILYRIGGNPKRVAIIVIKFYFSVIPSKIIINAYSILSG
jgi:hypothetical protein